MVSRLLCSLLLLCHGLALVRPQSSSKHLPRSDSVTAEEDHYALLRSRFNQYFNSFSPPHQADAAGVINPTHSESLPKPAESNSTAESTVSSSNLHLESSGSYVARNSAKDNRLKYLSQLKPAYKYKLNRVRGSSQQDKPYWNSPSTPSRLQPGGNSRAGEREEQDEEENVRQKPYRVAYAVKSKEVNNYFNREETSDGQRVTGQYRVLLPDGRIQTVVYAADKENGYNAVVTYKGTVKEQSDEDYLPQKPIHSTHAPRSAVISSNLQMGGSSLSPKFMYSSGLTAEPTIKSSTVATPDSPKFPEFLGKGSGRSILLAYHQLGEQLPRYAGRYKGKHFKSLNKVQRQQGYSTPSRTSGFIPSTYYSNLLYGMTPTMMPTSEVNPTVMAEMTPVIPVQTGKLAVLMTPLPSLTLAPPAVDAETLNPAFPFGRPTMVSPRGLYLLRDKLIVRCSHFNHGPWSPILPKETVHASNLTSNRNVSDSSISVINKASIQQSSPKNIFAVMNGSLQRDEGNGSQDVSKERAIMADSSEESPFPSLSYDVLSMEAENRSRSLTFDSDFEEMEHFMNFQPDKMESSFAATKPNNPEISARKLPDDDLKSIRQKFRPKQEKNQDSSLYLQG